MVTWLTQGFEGFMRGTFGNAGHNLYVSRAGILQRIHQFDLNKNGYLDLVLCNSQSHWECPPCYVYVDPLRSEQRIALPSSGALSAACADLTGSGFDDLVLGMRYDGRRFDLNAVIYFGSSEGYSERCTQQLPAPFCTAVAAGDFDGDGRKELTFVCHGKLRVFTQTALGFEPDAFVDLPIAAAQLGAGDLDGDGFDDLIVREADGSVRVYWGGDDGVDAGRTTVAGDAVGAASDQAVYEEYVPEPLPLPQVVPIGGAAHLFLARPHGADFLTAQGRALRTAFRLRCDHPMAVALGDVNGNGFDDLVIACRDAADGAQRSWIYWGGPSGYDDARRTAIPSDRACDVVVADLNDDGCAEVVLCHGRATESFTNTSHVHLGSPAGLTGEPIRLQSEDARRVFAVRHDADRPVQLVFVNHFSREALGRTDVNIFYGGADGFSPQRSASIAGKGAVEALCCDIDDDGHPDILLANCSENSPSTDAGSFVYFNDGRGRFNPSPDLALPTTRAHGIVCADLNRDGYLDVACVGFDNPELLIFHGTPRGFDVDHPVRIELAFDEIVYREPRWIHLADLNNDGWLDLVIPMIDSAHSFILWGGPDGFAARRHQRLSVGRAACARSVDLTGNGYLDLIVGGHVPTRGRPHDSFAYIYWNGPEGLSETRRMLLPACGVNAMAIADFNNDGLLDLFVCSYNDGKSRDVPSWIYWNRPGRGFACDDRTELHTHGASGCIAADFNRDGWIDLAVANHKAYGDHVAWSDVWWNGPEGFSPQRTTRLPSSGPHGICSVEVGNLHDRGPNEYYTSEPLRWHGGSGSARLHCDADTPPGAELRMQVRMAATRGGLDRAAWRDASWEIDGAAADAAWFQYRLTLRSLDGGASPRVRRVGITYADG